MKTINYKNNPETSNESRSIRCVLITIFCALSSLMTFSSAAQAQQSETRPQAAAATTVSQDTQAVQEASAILNGQDAAKTGAAIQPEKPRFFTRFSVAQLVRTLAFGVASDSARLPMLNLATTSGPQQRMKMNVSVSRHQTSTLALSYRF